MGTYVRPSDVRKVFKKIDTAKLTHADINFYISLAEAEINGKLAVRYSIPFASTPPLVKMIAVEISFLNVMDRFLMGEIRQSTVSRTDWREIRRDRINKILQDVVDGNCMLLDADGNEITPKAGIGDIFSTTDGYVNTMNMLDQTLQQIDPDRLDAEEDALD